MQQEDGKLAEAADNYRMGLLTKATKSRMKSKILLFLSNKTLVRLLLILSLVIYLPDPHFSLPVIHRAAAASNSPIGVGGGTNPESMETLIELEQDYEEIFELELYSPPSMLTFSSYTLKQGDMIGNIAAWSGLVEDTLISVNDIRNTRLMQIGQVIRIPNQDGIYHSVQAGDTLDSIAGRYNASSSHIRVANELFSDNLPPNSKLFVPGARLDWVSRQEINGDLFIWPTIGRITSPYGFRIAPFAGTRQFHSGIDISSPMGAPVRAAMAGRIARIGYDNTWGNYVIINHHSGYRTFYAHMNVVRTRVGAYVATGERIGDIGSTGLSTGPHLHFTVYKNNAHVNPRTLMRPRP